MTKRLHIAVHPLGGDPVSLYLVSSPAAIGRDRSCEVPLDDPKVSSRHAEIAWDGDTITLTDLGSKNGTFVDGRQIGSSCVAAGSSFVVGSTTVTVVGLTAGTDTFGPTPSQQEPVGPPKSSWAIWVVATVGLLVVAVLFLGSSGPGGSGGSGGPSGGAAAATIDLESPKVAASTDLGTLKSKNYPSNYAALSERDKAAVTQDDWTQRCKEEQAVAGEIRGFKVLGSRYLDAQKTIVAVEVEVDFSKRQKPITSTLFYEMKDGKPVHTMLWGREIRPAGGGQ